MTCPKCEYHDRAPGNDYCHRCTAEKFKWAMLRNACIAGSAVVALILIYLQPLILLAMGALCVVIAVIAVGHEH